jgi:hypothetical protein
MSNFQRPLWLSALAVLLLFTSCKKESSPEKSNPNEVITTVLLRLTPAGGGTPINATWKQLDPSGATAPDTSQAILNLLANKSYTAQLFILDESVSPADTSSEEVLAEANDHRIFYQPTNTNQILEIPGTPNNASGSLLNLAISIVDFDTNTPALELGLRSIFSTGSVSSGRLRVVLRHQPGVKDGTYAPGDSDIDVTFRVNIN